MEVVAPLLIVAVGLAVAVLVGIAIKTSGSVVKPLPPLRLSNHARERMEQRQVTEREILDVLRSPARVQRDEQQDSYRLEGDFPGKVLKVWVKEWPASAEIFVKSTAWQFREEMVVPAASVGRLIGRGGSEVARIERSSGARVHVGEHGRIEISAGEFTQIDRARTLITEIAHSQRLKPGDVVTVSVVKILPSGVLARTNDGVLGRLHVTQLRKLQAGRRVDEISSVAPIGRQLSVRVADVSGGRTEFELAVR